MVRFKNRYLLVELRFGSAKEGNVALKGATPKSVVGVVRDAVRGLHGDYGLACVQHSLHGESSQRTQPWCHPVCSPPPQSNT